MKIYAFHLLNDYSGSPKVLMQLIKGWEKNGIKVELITSNYKKGFLSGLKNIKYHNICYQWTPNPVLKLWRLFFSQLLVFMKFLFIIKRNDIIYINTVLPFGSAILGKLIGCRVIFHIHETTIRPALFKSFLFGIVNWTATDTVYVSNYIHKKEPFKKAKNHILYNAIESNFLEKAENYVKKKSKLKNVLMVCSLKDYKGVKEFVLLSSQNENYSFRLVLNATMKEIDQYFKKTTIPNNLKIYDTQTNLHPFYAWTDVILNLSRPDQWIETFGLTIIEGMAYGTPAIVPPVGGITELVEDRINGFLVDCRDSNLLFNKLKRLFNDPILYAKMSASAHVKINKYSEESLIHNSLKIIEAS